MRPIHMRLIAGTKNRADMESAPTRYVAERMIKAKKYMPETPR
nr:hypothetical protein [uncultured Desulfobacter sp.]